MFFQSLFSSTLLLAAATASALQPMQVCRENEDLLQFVMYLDENSHEENGWSLSCIGEGLIWDVPVGSLEEPNNRFVKIVAPPPGSDQQRLVQEEVCLPKDFTCKFTILDSWGDGLFSPSYYYLTFGAQTIAVSEDSAEFDQKTYCFGPECEEDALAKDVEDEADCDYVYFYFKTDDIPEDSSVRIMCDGETLLEKSDFTDGSNEIEYETCISTEVCCHLNVNDASKDGLIVSESQENYGAIFLEWGYQTVIEYDGIEGFEFSEAEFSFGLTCPDVSPVEPVVIHGSNDEGGLSQDIIDGIVDDFLKKFEEADETSLEKGALIAIILSSIAVVALTICYCVYRGRINDQSDAKSLDSLDHETISKGAEAFETDSDSDDA